MMALSKDYTITAFLPVKYINIPTDKVIANKLPDKVEIEVRSSGFNIMLFKLTSSNESLLIDINKAKPLGVPNHYYLANNLRLDVMNEQFRDKMEILRVSPDSIVLNYNRKVTKRVPVKSNLKINFKEQYQLKDSIRLNPSFVNVSGAEDVVSKINYVMTEKKEILNVSKSAVVKSNIMLTPDLKLAELSPSSIEISLEGVKYTEGTVEIPLEIINPLSGVNLRTFPSRVTAKYNVTIDNFEKVNPSQFTAVVDCKEIQKESNKLKVQLIKFPSIVNSVKIFPEKVEYIIRK
jgi:YbbR domain-containing protein